MSAAQPGTLSTDSELRERLAAKLRESDSLRAHIRQARLDAQRLRLQLRAAGGPAGESLVPARLGTGGGCGGAGASCPELRSVLQWLVDCVDIKLHAVFECGTGDCEVQVGGHRVQLGRMVTWPLAAGAGAAGLQFSVPLDMQADIGALVARAQACGHLDELEAQRFADAWDMVGGEIASSQLGFPTPAVFLIRRGSKQAMIIGSWPQINFAPKASCGSTPFDPARYFQSFEEAKLEGCQGNCRPNPPRVCMGDCVGTNSGSQRSAGVLQGIIHDLAHVHCEVGTPNMIAAAASVRPSRREPAAEGKKLPRRRRARSMG